MLCDLDRMEPRNKETFERSHPITNGLNPAGLIGNTQAGSRHHIRIHCAKCNAVFANPEDIYRIKDGCFWVFNYNRATVGKGHERFNGRKNDRECKAHCNRCKIRVGNIYPDGHLSSVEPHARLAAKFFPNQTGTSVSATVWKGDPSKHVPQSAEDAAPSGLVRCEMEEALIREAASLGLLEYSSEHVRALRDSGVIRLRFMKGNTEEETEELKQFRHMFLKYADVKTGPEDWEHTQFIVLISSFGLNEKWTKFIMDALTLVTVPQGLKFLHRAVEDSVLLRMEKDPAVLQLREETKLQLLRRLEETLGLDCGSLQATANLPVKDLYSSAHSTIHEHEVGYFISLDMKSSNFNVLRLLGGTGTAKSWEELLVQCNSRFGVDAVKFAAKNKWLRVKTLGKIIPKRIKFCQYALMSFLCTKLIESQLQLSETSPFLFSCDEIIIPCDSELSQAKAKVERVLSSLPGPLIEILRCSSMILKEYDMSEEMLEKRRAQQRLEQIAQQDGNSMSPTKKPSNGGWSSLADCGDENFETPNLNAGAFSERTTFFVRFDENSRPQPKGIPYYLRFGALKQARLFDPAKAFKHIEKRNWEMRDTSTQKCKFFLQGRCIKGRNCSFLHEK